MFGFGKKKKELVEKKKSYIEEHIVPIDIATCDKYMANLYYDEETDRFYDFIMPYKRHVWKCVSDEFDGHILVSGYGFIHEKSANWYSYTKKPDIRDIKVLSENVILTDFLKEISVNNRLLLSWGFITIDNCLQETGSCSYEPLAWLRKDFKYWDVNHTCTLSRIFNGLPKDKKNKYIAKCKNIEYTNVELNKE